MTTEFEARVKKAVDERLIPNAVVLARDKSGKMDYSFSYGPTTLNPDATPAQISPDSMFSMFSMTKLITSICALKLVEEGVVGLEEDVSKHLETLATQPVLTGFDDASGQPTYKERTRPITLRRLLTHSAGNGYILMHDRLRRWAETTGRPVPVPLQRDPVPGGSSTVDTRFDYPLLFEPGESWVYGSGLDWAGRLVEKLSGVPLDDFVYENVLAPVGVPRGAMTFHPLRFRSSPPDALVGTASRDPGSGKVAFLPTEHSGEQQHDAFGGEGLFGGAGQYVKVLHSILADDGKILKPQTARYLFEPLLEPAAREALNAELDTADWAVGVIPKGVDYDWSAGGLLSTGGDGLGHRKKGFLQWGGMLNMSWFIDREAGVCGVFGTQLLPVNDAKVKELTKEFEDAIYSRL
ncbi:beta-lactamase/transpeptidase-like protein [Thermothelomyces heterothallicus CBS 202.75]|uniref:beta-lactamase/transpeptidase-like protein n=1 Tax=Thermothelomyces heterothallicus CBS 202.75 TaxID=1149848 RepID=UPI0037436724